jgi:hypothetical protein
VSWIEAVRETDGRVYFDGAHFYEEWVLDLPLELASKEKIRTALSAETSTSRDEENRLLKQWLGSLILTPKKGFERDPKTAVPVKVALPVKLWRGVGTASLRGVGDMEWVEDVTQMEVLFMDPLDKLCRLMKEDEKVMKRRFEAYKLKWPGRSS